MTHLAYDPNGNLAQIIDPDNAQTGYQYADGLHLSATIDPLGNKETRLNDFAGRVQKVTRADGSSYQITYLQATGLYKPMFTANPNTVPLAITTGSASASYTDPNGNVTMVSLDQRSQVATVTNPLGQTSSGVRDLLNDILTVTTPAVQTAYTYDENGNVVSIHDKLSGATTTLTYDTSNLNAAIVFNKITSVTDPLGHKTQYQYDPFGEVIAMTLPDGSVWHYTYTNKGLETEMDPLGHTTRYTYDPMGRKLSETDPLGGTTTTPTTPPATSSARLTRSVTPRPTGMMPQNRQTSTTDALGGHDNHGLRCRWQRHQHDRPPRSHHDLWLQRPQSPDATTDALTARPPPPTTPTATSSARPIRSATPRPIPVRCARSSDQGDRPLGVNHQGLRR